MSAHEMDHEMDNEMDHEVDNEHDYQRQDFNDAVVDGGVSGSDHEAYEYHYATEMEHEVHGNAMNKSVLFGSGSDDLLYGGGNDDVLDGSVGSDTLDGGEGHDVLIGGGLSDEGLNQFQGGGGDDILVAGGHKTRELDHFFQSHADIVNSINADSNYASLLAMANGATEAQQGTAQNRFEMRTGNGHDKIFNFHADTDKLIIERAINHSDIHDEMALLRHVNISGNDVEIDLGAGNSVTLVGVDVQNLSLDNIGWV